MQVGDVTEALALPPWQTSDPPKVSNEVSLDVESDRSDKNQASLENGPAPVQPKT
jgi:hypothetical protein